MNKLVSATILAASAALALALSPALAVDQVAPKNISFGVKIAVTPEGPEIVEMLPDRTAAAVGFKVGDILIEAGGKPISQEVLTEYLNEKKPGDHVSFKVKRADTVIELTGMAVAPPEGAQAPTTQSQE